MNKSNKCSAEVRERAVRMVREHRDEYPSQWAAIESIAPKIGCTSQTLPWWVKREEVDSGKRIRSTIPDVTAQRPLDRINRQFKADRPNQLWVSDFTYVSTWQSWLYVAFVIDAFARRIVGWRVSSPMTTDSVLGALEQALYARRPDNDGTLIHHSDRGSQYVSIRYSERLAEAGVEELLATTIAVAADMKAVARNEFKRLIVDSTVQAKAIAFPPDSRLLEVARAKMGTLAHRALEFASVDHRASPVDKQCS